ncbi:sensor histidine kinase [Actinomadura scrupuli]|uniref:sensor histidine kinase n=1 Tax=Actinomadura scrupuli TaxID=559629 RepID=UPI003D97E171
MRRNRRVPSVDVDRMDTSGPDPGPFYFWLVLAVWPARDVIEGGSRPVWLAAATLVLGAALYLVVIWAAFSARVRLRTAALLLGLLVAVAVAAGLGFGGRWITLLPLTGVACGSVIGHHGTRRGELALTGAVLGLSGVAALTAWSAGRSGGDVFSICYGTGTATLVTGIILRLFAVVSVLKQTRDELARSAVAQERLRFARDLHDLLGHTLSLVVVKAQAVRRLAVRDPALAAEQAADIETVGRQALAEVRQAVTGYRGRGLTAELDAARMALSDAGVSPVIHQEGPPLPPEGDALLGWVVREGVTNVIRHSRARTCEIDVRHRAGTVTVEIGDDGAGLREARPGRRGGTGPQAGHGLDGLSERMVAAGGTLQAAPRRGGGFRLRASLPIEQAAGTATKP